MAKIQYLKLKNYCGYRDVEFDFTDENEIKPLAMFFGRNGCGKSTVLDAVRMLSTPWLYTGRETDMLFRKVTYHTDYDPGYQSFQRASENMRIEGVFHTDEGEKTVVIETDGVKQNELKPETKSTAYFVDADNPMNMNKFQLRKEAADLFLDIAKAVYGFDCWLEKEVAGASPETDALDAVDKSMIFYTDFVIVKPYEENVRVHFRRMSAGERKIATMLSMLCDPFNLENHDMFCVDNIAMHIHSERHINLMKKLWQHFSEKQILATTHSPILIGNKSINLDPYVDSKYLYDIEAIRQDNRKVNNV